MPGKISNVQKRKFLPMFSCDMLTCSPPLLARVHSRHAKFRATDPPVPSSKHVRIIPRKLISSFFSSKFGHICIVDASGPSSKTSDWCHDGIEDFLFVSDGYISAHKKPFVGKKNSTRKL